MAVMGFPQNRNLVVSLAPNSIQNGFSPTRQEEAGMFIELHRQSDGKAILINVNSILSLVETAKDSTGTVIHLSDPKMQSVTVRESYRDIKNKLSCI